MFWSLATIILAFAVFSVLAIRLPRRQGWRQGTVDREQFRGFVYVGAAALAALAGLVVAVGLFGNRRGIAEAVAVLGMLGYLVYLGAAGLVLAVGGRRRRQSGA